MRSTVIALAVLALGAVSCQSQPPAPKSDFPAAQALIDATVAEHTDLVRLTIHAVPTGQTQSRIIACNLAEKIGKASDPEDLEAMETGKTVILKEGDNLDVTAPILDKRGKAVAAAGITLRIPGGAAEDEVVEEAKAIAAELTSAIQAAPVPLW
jgi:hypothetical protein